LAPFSYMAAATIKKLRPGDVLFNEGDDSKSLFIVKKGAISIRKTKNNTFVEIAKVQANQVIGELSFFDRLPRSAAAIAMIDTELLEISFESLQKVYDQIPDYMKSMIASLADRLRRANDDIRILQKKKENQASADGTDGGENGTVRG